MITPTPTKKYRVLVIPASPHAPMYMSEVGDDMEDLDAIVGSKYCSSMRITFDKKTGIDYRLWRDDATKAHTLLYNSQATELSGLTIVGDVVLFAIKHEEHMVDLDEKYAVSVIQDYELRVSTSLQWRNL